MDDTNEILLEAAEAFASEKYNMALSLIEPLVKNENASAIGMLGLAYQQGFGVETNGNKAIELLERAVAMGDGTAAHNLGTIYITGMPGIERNPEKAKELYRLAKEYGAQFADDSWYE